MSLQGSAPHLVYEEGVSSRGTLNFLDWTRDGRYLIIFGGRSGRRALYLVPRDRKPAGEPIFLRHVALPRYGLFRSAQAGQSIVRIHDTSTGEDREVYRAVDVTRTWASRKPKLVCSVGGSGNSAIDAISPDSGAVEHLSDVKVRYILMDRLNRDDKAVYFGRLRRGGYDISLWDAASGQGRVLNRSEAPVDAKR